MKTKSIFVSAGLLLAFGAQAVVQDSVTFTGVESNFSATAYAQTRTYNSTVSGYTLGRIDLAGTLEEVNTTTGDFLSENRVRLTSPTGRVFEMIPLGTGYVGPVATTASTFNFTSFNPVGTWTFDFRNSFDDSPLGEGSLEAQWNDITISFTDEQYAGTRPDAEDLGAISDTSADYETADRVVNLPDHDTSSVKWYKFSIASSVSNGAGTFLDIDTTGSGFDTEIGVYDNYGSLVATDDDDGASFESALSFGEVGPRQIPGAAAANGRDGSMGDGTYYLAMGEWNVNYGANDYDVTTTAATVSTFVLNFRTNIPGGGGASISGAVVLADWTGATAGRSCDMEVFSGVTSVQTASATLDAGGNFSFPTTLADGSYDLIINANRGWLKKKVAITVTGGSATVASTTVRNGDIVDDGVIDLTDYTAVATGFNGLLSDPNNGGNPSANWNALADVNGDGVIDLTDYTVVATNFNALDDAP